MKAKKKIFENAPEGTFPATITVAADLGVQKVEFEGKTKWVHEVGLSFELSGKATKEGRPFAVLDHLRLSVHEKARLYQVAQAALGKVPEELDPKELLGRMVLITVAHRKSNGRTYANVVKVTGLTEGMKVTPTKTPLLYFDLEAPDPKVYEQLPAFFKTLIEKRLQPPTARLVEELEEDVPL